MRCIVLIFIGWWGISVSAQAPKWNSKQIFDYSKRVSAVTKNQIWNELEPMKYIALKSEKESQFVAFSENFESSNSSFSWRLTDEYFFKNTLEDNLVITFHEAFHAFAADKKRGGKEWKYENSMLIFEYQESSARNNALFNIEGKILNSALQTKNISQLKEKVRQFLAIRKLRQSEIEPRFIEFEKGAESNEGMAEYAGLNAVVLAMKLARQKKLEIKFTFSNPESFLANKYELLGAITNVGKNIRRKFYYTGSAQGFLLDRLMKDWKTKVQMDAEAVQDLLETAVGKTSTKGEIEKILTQYKYEKILAEEEQSVAKRKAENQSLLENTLNQKGRKYTINYSALTGWTGIRNFDPMNVTMISPKVRVHTRSVRFGNEKKFTAEFSQPVVEDLDKKEYTTFVAEKESVVADGKEIDLNKSGELKFDKSLAINSDNFKLEANAGVIRITKDSVAIEIFEK